jgi:hypothetical protein
MTHDELVSKLKKQHDYWSNLVHYTKPEFYENTVDQRNGWSALLAVVKLHEPQDYDYNMETVSVCSCQHGVTGERYPCDIIEAIEKELK